MLVRTYSCALMGVAAIQIAVEVSVDVGIGFHLVGLPDSAVKESQQRIETALKLYKYNIPGRKIVVNMAPADIRKEGSAFDLTLAIAILAASEQIKGADRLEDYYIMGELSLDGSMQPIRGALPIAIEARKKGKKALILPAQNAREAAIVDGLEILGVENIKQVIDYFDKDVPIIPTKIDIELEFRKSLNNYEYDFSDVKRWPAPSPTSTAARILRRDTSARPSISAAWTGTIGGNDEVSPLKGHWGGGGDDSTELVSLRDMVSPLTGAVAWLVKRAC